MRVLIICALVGAAMCLNPELDEHWAKFTEKFGKDVNDMARRAIFEENVKRITLHNIEADLDVHTYRLGLNKYADMTNEEFRKIFNGYRKNVKVENDYTKVDVSDLPASVDWRTQGYVTPIKDQGQCGSCWAFSTTGSVEGAYFKSTGKLVSLSEQNLVDCSGSEGNYGCDGGLMDSAFDYIIKNKGIDTEDSYPYKAVDGKCKFSSNSIGATIKSYVDVKSGDESALQKAVATIGPISVAIDASNYSFQLYSSGVYNEKSCSSSSLDHGVLAVGYDTTSDGKDYWIVKNSWGTSWGQKGYIWMTRNKKNQCGIATSASYPIA